MDALRCTLIQMGMSPDEAAARASALAWRTLAERTRPDTPEERRAMARRYVHPTGGLLQPGWRR